MKSKYRKAVQILIDNGYLGKEPLITANLADNTIGIPSFQEKIDYHAKVYDKARELLYSLVPDKEVFSACVAIAPEMTLRSLDVMQRLTDAEFDQISGAFPSIALENRWACARLNGHQFDYCVKAAPATALVHLHCYARMSKEQLLYCDTHGNNKESLDTIGGITNLVKANPSLQGLIPTLESKLESTGLTSNDVYFDCLAVAGREIEKAQYNEINKIKADIEYGMRRIMEMHKPEIIADLMMACLSLITRDVPAGAATYIGAKEQKHFEHLSIKESKTFVVTTNNEGDAYKLFEVLATAASATVIPAKSD